MKMSKTQTGMKGTKWNFIKRHGLVSVHHWSVTVCSLNVWGGGGGGGGGGSNYSRTSLC